MIFLDAYPLVALLLDEPAAAEVAPLLRLPDVAVPAINLAEVIDVAHRRHKVAIADIRSVLEPISGAGTLTVTVAGADEAWRAARIRAQHYQRRASELSLADCFLLAAATVDDRIATADPPVAAAARALGIGVVALPDSTGVRP